MLSISLLRRGVIPPYPSHLLAQFVHLVPSTQTVIRAAMKDQEFLSVTTAATVMGNLPGIQICTS